MVIVIVVVIITFIIAVTKLRNAGSAQRDLCLSCVPVTDALQLGRVVVMLIIAAPGDSNSRAASPPAAVWNIVLLQFGCDSDVACEDEATQRKKLLDTHDGRSSSLREVEI